MILGFDTLDLLFLGATAWVGPFWIMMLAFPEHPLTVRMLRPPWFMLGPLVIYTGVGLTQASLMAEVLADLVRPNRVHEGFATIMGSVEGGAVMTWAHLILGDFFATIWIYHRNMRLSASVGVHRLTVFFGVMFMPLGLILHLILVREADSSQSNGDQGPAGPHPERQAELGPA